ncbi:DEAD/DEAH box helicase family protein [Polyangium sorediatum]|uniref:DEAD/DEAH box helicase family protein n=2 Tax=Polyangium sorediatum TaxID=889274 RepID=A0ABT6PAG1_9BACT|nr:DEAD/DEAH box helicase family protein [Polyangium sorediatum]
MPAFFQAGSDRLGSVAHREKKPADRARTKPQPTRVRAEKEKFAPSITEWMVKLKRNVEHLTNDQVKALHQIRFRSRALITGCAGSGKTLLAAEKAIRLDAAGMRTLLLCHNPNLAQHLASLVANSSVDVYDITTFVNKLAEVATPERLDWTAFDEPLDQDVNHAFDAVNKTTASYEAIIVDEGQDFRESWWALIDAFLEYSRTKTLYVFYDDNQALLPHRAPYPMGSEPISMSKNCRNGGNIFEIVRRFHRDAPLTSSVLTADGIAKVTPFDERDLDTRLTEALLDAHKYAKQDRIRVLTNESSAEASKINGFEFVKHSERRWQIVVTNELRKLCTKALRRVDHLRSGNSHSEIANRYGIPLDQAPAEYLVVPQLSHEATPTSEDVRAVRQLATRMRPFFEGTAKAEAQFFTRNEGIYLGARTHTGKETTVNDATKARFYSSATWASSLRAERPTKVLANHASWVADQVIPLYSVDAFKGLECDALVFFVNSINRNLPREMYVGSSRAVCYLHVVISRSVLSRLKSLADLDPRFLSDSEG